MELDEEYNLFLQDLHQFPNYFQMGTEKCGTKFWKKIAKKVEDEKQELLKSSELDQIKNQNLEACASYNLGEVDKAVNIISKVLEDTNFSSINACAMMAILSYRKGEITKAKRLLSHIKELAADPFNIDVAKTELAYAYTRLNATFYKKAIAAYTEAVERNPNNFPWKFGLGVIYRRCMNTAVQTIFPDLKLETCFYEVKKHLTYVIENCTDEQDRFFKARSYIELADLYSTANTTDKLTHTDKYTIIDLVHQGVQCLPENTAILMKAGRILRHCFRFEEAEELLKKAYDICPNSYICHQLGLTLKNNFLHHHKQSKRNTKDQRYGAKKQNQDSHPSNPSASSPLQNNVTTQVDKKLEQQSERWVSEKVNNSFKQLDNKLSPKKQADLQEPKIDESMIGKTKTLTEPKPVLKHTLDTENPTTSDNDLETDLAIGEPVYQSSFPIVSPCQTTLKQQDPQQRGSFVFDNPYYDVGSHDPFDPQSPKMQQRLKDDDLDPGRHSNKGHQLLAENFVVDDPNRKISTESPIKSKSEKELSETLSKVSLSSTGIPGIQPDRDISQAPSLSNTGIPGIQPDRDISQAPSLSITGLPGIQPDRDISQAPSLSKVTNKTMTEEPLKEVESLPPISLESTSATEKSDSQNNPIMKRLINSPGKETFDPELSRKLESCIDLFRQSAELGQGRNLAVYYDWGITLLQMTPTKFGEVMEKFNHILENDSSPFGRYRCYEQYGICKLRMSELQEISQMSREEHQKDAVEMFRRAIRYWAYCQKMNLSNHFDDAEGNCSSFKSIREIILGEDSKQGTKPKKDMASLYYLVKQYGSSLSLYQEVHEELQRTSNTDTDSEVIKGIINNHIQLKQFTGILDMLALLLCSTEGLQSLEFKTDVLTQLMYHSIDTNDYHLSESVFNFEKNPNEEYDSDVAIIFDEDDKVMKKTGATLQNWLCAFSKSGLKVIKSSETAANLPRLEEQIKLICNSKMAIFILANDNPTKLTYLMNSALEARCSDDYVLKKILPISINDGMVPDILKSFRSLKFTQDPNTVDEHEKSFFLKTFSDIYLQ